MYIQGGPKKRIPSFIFGITSAHSFTVTSRNLWRVNMKFFHPPHLYCVTTLSSKTNITANIGIKCLHFSRNVMVSVGVSRMGKTRVVFINCGAKFNSLYYCNIVLEKSLLPDIRAICRHYRWTPQQDGAPAHTSRTTMDYLNKENTNFI